MTFIRKNKIKLEEKLNLDAFNELHMAFNEADADGSGTLELDEFKEVVKGALKIQGRVCLQKLYICYYLSHFL